MVAIFQDGHHLSGAFRLLEMIWFDFGENRTNGLGDLVKIEPMV